MINELVLATSNPGKIQELQSILAPIHCISQQTLNVTDADETGLSFVENAIIKARHAATVTNKPSLADDSGLVIPALNGEPGIYSARYPGLIDGVLKKLLHIKNRRAYFYCAIAIVQYAKDPTPLIATGIVHGEVLHERRGTQGFGYDPIFYLPSHDCSFAELSPAIKNTLSHRAQAIAKLKELINDA